MDKKTQAVKTSRDLINDDDFKARHRLNDKAFTRLRTLTFSIVLILLVRKSVKSLQLVLNEFADEHDIAPVTDSAFTQARSKLHHTAFIELNQKAVYDVMYSDRNIKLYKGMRVVGIDGSKVLLPHHKSVIEEFGEISYSNDHPDVTGSHAYGLASTMYDVLNRVAIDTILGKSRDYEIDLAITHHLPFTQEDDLLIFDRNYPSYIFIALLILCNRKFLMRCSAASFSIARRMLNGEGPDEQTVVLKPHHTKHGQVIEYDLPEEVTVRFVRVTLDTGEYEVLVTNLLDTETFPLDDFKELYFLRWGTEGFYKILKSRLNLENFTGKTAESVYQDFYAAVYLSGLESILIEDSNIQLSEKDTKHPQQVNHAVSFNTIKNQVFKLLGSDFDIDVIVKKLETLFLTKPVLIREERKVPRIKRSARHRLHHATRKQKICF